MGGSRMEGESRARHEDPPGAGEARKQTRQTKGENFDAEQCVEALDRFEGERRDRRRARAPITSIPSPVPAPAPAHTAG